MNCSLPQQVIISQCNMFEKYFAMKYNISAQANRKSSTG